MMSLFLCVYDHQYQFQYQPYFNTDLVDNLCFPLLSSHWYSWCECCLFSIISSNHLIRKLLISICFIYSNCPEFFDHLNKFAELNLAGVSCLRLYLCKWWLFCHCFLIFVFLSCVIAFTCNCRSRWNNSGDNENSCLLPASNENNFNSSL